MDKVGTVISTDNGMAKVAVHRTSGCKGGCKTCSGCDTPEIMVVLPNQVGAMRGDTVELRANNTRVLKYTIILYSIPLLFFIFGIGISYSVFKNVMGSGLELYSFMVGVACFFISLLILRVIDRRLGNQDTEMMSIYRVVDQYK